MGYFFRRSARVGPFRLNFSKSGVGGSVGVKGARLTMTPRGTTYVTVGSHGFYYRETVANSGTRQRVPRTDPASPQPRDLPDSDKIASADSTQLVDSSSEKFVERLNQCANMANPAWLFYIAAAISIAALTILPAVPSLPDFPDVATPDSVQRNSNTVDEYSALTARFGEPNSIRLTVADPMIPIPI